MNWLPGFLAVGGTEEAQSLTDLFFPAYQEAVRPPAPEPSTIETFATVVTEPTTLLDEELNRLALQTHPVNAYEIVSYPLSFLSPTKTNIRVEAQGFLNPPGYYSAMNLLAHRGHSASSIASGIAPEGSPSRIEALWMLTQQLETDQILDLTPSSTACFLPYYPFFHGQEMSFGCINVRNIDSTQFGQSVKLEVTNTATGKKTITTVTNKWWPVPEALSVEELGVTAAKANLFNTMILSANGHQPNDLLAAATVLINANLSAIPNITEQDKESALTEAILTIRQELGPGAISRPEQLQLLKDFIEFLVTQNPSRH